MSKMGHFERSDNERRNGNEVGWENVIGGLHGDNCNGSI